jgi:hypothetical protein
MVQLTVQSCHLCRFHFAKFPPVSWKPTLHDVERTACDAHNNRTLYSDVKSLSHCELLDCSSRKISCSSGKSSRAEPLATFSHFATWCVSPLLSTTRLLDSANTQSTLTNTVRSESRCALRLRYVELIACIKVAVKVCCCFTVFRG